jgi:hypothetical protein
VFFFKFDFFEVFDFFKKKHFRENWVYLYRIRILRCKSTA